MQRGVWSELCVCVYVQAFVSSVRNRDDKVFCLVFYRLRIMNPVFCKWCLLLVENFDLDLFDWSAVRYLITYACNVYEMGTCSTQCAVFACINHHFIVRSLNIDRFFTCLLSIYYRLAHFSLSWNFFDYYADNFYFLSSVLYVHTSNSLWGSLCLKGKKVYVSFRLTFSSWRVASCKSFNWPESATC